MRGMDTSGNDAQTLGNTHAATPHPAGTATASTPAAATDSATPNTPIRKVRIGLVGYGFGGKYFHAPLIASAANCELAGVVTRSAKRKAEVESDHPGVPTVGSLEELAELGIDAVAISSPADTHTALTREAIALGIPVVSDKPFSLTADEAAETVRLAREANVLLSVYQNRRWDSDFLTVRKLIAAGELGDVTHFESSFERFADPAGVSMAGAGVMRDFGAHLFDQALQLFGPVARVYAETAPAAGPAGEAGYERRFFAALTHENGVVSHLKGDWSQGAPGWRYRVQGTKASYVVTGENGMDYQEHLLISGKSPRSEGEAWGQEPEQHWGELRSGDTTRTIPTERGRWDTFYPAFARAVAENTAPPVDPEDAIASMRLIDAARKSAETGEVVHIN